MRKSIASLSGLSLIIGSIIAIIGSAAHPRSPEETEPVASITASLIRDHEMVWLLTHGGLLVMTLIVTVGFLGFYYLAAKRQLTKSILAASLIVSFGVLSLFVFALDGFVGPVLADQSASDAFVYNYYFGLVITAISFVAYFPAIAASGWLYLRSGWRHAWLGWGGIALGLGGLAAYVAGLLGTYWVYSPAFPPLIAIVTLWTLVLGVMIWRQRATI